MEKYKTYEYIDKKDITSFEGLENEILTYIYPSGKSVPLTVECFGITFPNKHYHIKRTNCTHFVLEYIASGKGFLINGERKYTLREGDVYLLEPGTSHEYYSDKTAPLEKYWINFRSEIFFYIFKSFNLSDTTVFKNADIRDNFKQIFELEKISLNNDDIYERASSIIFDMFMKLSQSKKATPEFSELAHHIKFSLDQSITSKVNLDQICEKLYISRSKLFREFKKYYGITPYDYLMERKLNAAKMYLKNTNHSVKAIAETLSFSNDHYFCNFFKQKTGISPTEYRLSEKGEQV